ncbi:aromatic amino acid lyase [Nesterenkonia flava]|uniref:Aromatic amino acid lyase n=1 Tax=Nesterenkonia flava TaxID=469799 RepID=A0ABU1FTA4_9MICC|nr:aromatic amino acid lyase [Nesterenkonia flava]MDR5711895.1 aromatic amino acid lyase [Nesterenkonia flava]
MHHQGNTSATLSELPKRSSQIIEIGRKPLTLTDIVRIAHGTPAALAPEVLASLERAYQRAEEISVRYPVYGRSTGVGANRLTPVNPEDSEHGMRLLRSHAADAGDPIPAPAVRAMLGIRLSQLAGGQSGINPEVALGLERMLQTNALPELRELGSIGTADLAALAGTALALTGERPTSTPFTPIGPFGMESALPFMSSSALTLARAALALDELRRLERSGRVIAALSALAVRANTQAFSRASAYAAASPGAALVAQQMRKLTKRTPVPARIQDPFGFRAYVPSQAAVVAAMDTLQLRVEQLSSVSQENPLFDFQHSRVIHHGNFHQVALGLAVDGLNLALAQSAPLIMSRINMLHEPAFNGVEPFLARGPAGSSGHMMIEYIAASAMGELRNAAQPASLGTVVLSRGAEEDASFATQAVVQLERAVKHYRPMLAVELLSAHRAAYQLGKWPPKILRGVVSRLHDELPITEADHDLRPDVEKAASLLDDLAEGVL